MVLLVYSIIYVLISPYAGRLSDKIKPSTLCIIAMLSATINAFVFSFSLQFQGFLFVFIFLIWLALSYVLFFSPNNNQVMSLAPKNKHGVASGLFNTTTNLSYVFGIAIFETVFSHAIPGISSAKASLLNANIPHEVLLKGFQATYILGGLACLVAFGFSLMVRQQYKKKT
jgi:MFS family permease